MLTSKLLAAWMPPKGGRRIFPLLWSFYFHILHLFASIFSLLTCIFYLLQAYLIASRIPPGLLMGVRIVSVVLCGGNPAFSNGAFMGAAHLYRFGK